MVKTPQSMIRLSAILILFYFFLFPSTASAQYSESVTMSIDEVIMQAQGITRRTTLAKTRLNNRYWTYTAFKGKFKPKLELTSTLPSFNRSIDRITLPDGADIFLSRSILSTSSNLRISQIVPSLGTRISASSGLQRIEVFNEDDPNQTSFLSTPISLSLNQRIFSQNEHKWDRQIQPLRYSEAEKQFVEEMEYIGFDAVRAFFNYYIAQLDLESAFLDKQNADSLYALSLGRYEVGRIAETDLLQIQLNVKSAESAIAQAEIDLQNSAEDIRTLLNIQEDIMFDLVAPPELPEVEIDPEYAIKLAKENRSESLGFKRRILESEKNKDAADKNNGLEVTVSGSFGLSQTADNIGDAYNEFIDQERVAVNIYIPIADWGQSQAERERAKSQLALTRITVEQEEQQFEREIEIQITQFGLQKNKLDLEKISYEVAEKRLEINRSRYLIGKIGVIDLNQALSTKENARKNYMQALKQYWLSYYQLRNLCLYDFIGQRLITY
jgi:outer membrane protein TolC